MSNFVSWENHYANIAKARADGFAIIYGDDSTLLLDLDTEAQKEHYEFIKNKFPFGKEVERWKSKSGNDHVVIKLKSPAPLELRIAMQAALGSDPLRTICEIQQVIDKANPIALFKPAPSNKKQEGF